jgi:hypothetical protein
MNDQPTKASIPGAINANTYISGSLVVVVLGGFMAVLNSLYSTKGEITARLDKVEWRMGSYEKSAVPVKESWTDMDMLRWSVKLQRANEGKIIVPEPEISTK